MIGQTDEEIIFSLNEELRLAHLATSALRPGNLQAIIRLQDEEIAYLKWQMAEYVAVKAVMQASYDDLQAMYLNAKAAGYLPNVVSILPEDEQVTYNEGDACPECFGTFNHDMVCSTCGYDAEVI
jgi:hypothetical protein